MAEVSTAESVAWNALGTETSLDPSSRLADNGAEGAYIPYGIGPEYFLGPTAAAYESYTPSGAAA